MDGETRVVHVYDYVEGAVYIGRSLRSQRIRASPLANPFKITKEYDRELVIRNYRNWLHGLILIQRQEKIDALIACRGKPLACWCRHDGEKRTSKNACHGDVIVEILERYSDDELRALRLPEPREETE